MGIKKKIIIIHLIAMAVFLSVAGRFQRRNIQIALLAVEYLQSEVCFAKITKQSIEQGLSNLRKLTGLHGRCEIINFSPLIIADVCHNPDAVASFLTSMSDYAFNNFIIIFGLFINIL